MNTTDVQHESERGARDSEGLTQRTAKAASDAYSAASAVASDAADQAKRVASDAASTVSQQMKQFLDGQVGGGANMVGHVANSVKRAADELDRDAPQLAGLVRGVADRFDGYADELRGQSVDQLVRKASDFTRRQPALVFGIAALAGFFALRTLKATPPVSAPSIQPGYPGD
jgi:ElaB/YqjD/DUF883 family membrane-anchored ribosome-binding protein